MIGLQSLRALDGAQVARIWLATEATDMRCGFDRLAERVKTVIGEDPLGGHLFVFRSRHACNRSTGHQRLLDDPPLLLYRAESPLRPTASHLYGLLRSVHDPLLWTRSLCPQRSSSSQGTHGVQTVQTRRLRRMTTRHLCRYAQRPMPWHAHHT